MLRIRKGARGSVVLELEPEEAAILHGLPGRMRSLLENPDFSDRIIARLFPRAYDDPSREAEYRELLSKDLVTRKLQAADALEAALSEGSVVDRDTVVTITPERFDLILSCVNDMRLVLGTKLDIVEDSWRTDLDPDHPEAYEMALLHYLTLLEEELLAASGLLGKRG